MSESGQLYQSTERGEERGGKRSRRKKKSAELQAADAGKLHFIEMMDASNTALGTN